MESSNVVEDSTNAATVANKVVKRRRHLSVEEMLDTVGGYGKFQKMINLLFCLMTIPSFTHVMITYFTAHTPSWICKTNSTRCQGNTSLPGVDQSRCSMTRKDWSYVATKHYSIVTEWSIDCESAWLKELVMSIFFLGWLVGAPTLGWVADNYGRRKVLLHSMNMVLLVGFLTAFSPNIYLFIICRFLVAFFITGTFPQMFVVITEIVGSRHRTFSGMIIYTFCAVALAIVGVVAYFVRSWKLLYIVTSTPYIVILAFYRFIPESVQYLHAKGETEHLMTVFRRISSWNKKPIPDDVMIAVRSSDTKGKRYPLQMFKVKKLAWITLVQSMTLFLNVVTYYGLYIAAGDIGGSMYRDFVIVTIAEIPLSLAAILSSNRFGRKSTTLFLIFISFLSCLGLIFVPRTPHLQTIRITLGMIGKGCNGAGYLVLTSWGMDLYPTEYRSEAMGILQVFTRLGGMFAPWMDTELEKVYKGLSFVFMSTASLLSCFLLWVLPPPSKETAVVNQESKRNDDVGTEVVLQNNAAFDPSIEDVT